MTVQDLSPESPYVGLAPFETAHADYFFGRTLDAAVLADSVLARRTTVLYGASGVGKSSLMNVGLPAALSDLGVAARIVFRREWHETGRIGGWLEEATGTGGTTPSKPLLLVLDQFEEYFLYADTEQLKQFARSLAALIGRRDVEAHLLFAVRDDGLHRLDALRMHLTGLLDTTLELPHLDDRGVREAIEQPIIVWNQRHTPVMLESDFAESLIAQLHPKDEGGQPVEGSRIELPYLQLALQKIWEAEGGAAATAMRTATLTERLKGISEISRRHVDEVLNGVSEEGQAICATVFDRLVTPSGGKILYATADLAAVAGLEPGRIDDVLVPLASGKTRLLRAVDLPGKRDARGYEILHDILARPILDWRTTYQEAKERAEAVRSTARLEREAAQERELIQMRALAEEQARRVLEKAAAAKRLKFALIFLVILSSMTVVFAVIAALQRHMVVAQQKRAMHEARRATLSSQQAEVAEMLARERLERIMAGIKLRQAILSGGSIPSEYINEEIRFHAITKEYPYRSPAGYRTYKFTLSPVASSVAGGLASIAFITYRMAHPTFPNPLFATGPDRNFTASYDGTGCLSQVVALIEFADPDKQPSIATFNMCQQLGWQ